MRKEYQDWIGLKYPKFQDALGKCVEAVKAMAKEFPELTITNGFAHFPTCGPRAHWWCKDAEGNIVDPTGHQYPEYVGSPIVDYEEIDDNHEARRYAQTKCMNCGEYYYVKPELKGLLHNEKCNQDFAASLSSTGAT